MTEHFMVLVGQRTQLNRRVVRRLPMRGVLLPCLLLLAAAIRPAYAQTDWEQLSHAMSAFLEYPSSANALAARELIPHEHVGNEYTAARHQTRDIIFQSLPMLERQVEARDQEAVRLAFALYAVADVETGPMLDIILGKLIRIDPELFLRELSPRLNRVPMLRSLVGNHGQEYIDRIEAGCLELRLRIVALEGVGEQDLAVARERCLTLLRELLARRCE